MTSLPRTLRGDSKAKGGAESARNCEMEGVCSPHSVSVYQHLFVGSSASVSACFPCTSSVWSSFAERLYCFYLTHRGNYLFWCLSWSPFQLPLSFLSLLVF
uniref:Uncharacterized protein n=1 Tax=Mola mola TaxID=94237 RepID=A0A3Q3XKJ9_MOLML